MLDYLTQNPSQTLLAGLISGLLAVMAVEMLAPRRPESEDLAYRWTQNLSVAALNYLLARWAGLGLALAIAGWAEGAELGLLRRLDIEGPAAFAALMLATELAGYLLHRAYHRVPLMWRIHAVHHCDTEMDVTTAQRHHPIEALVWLPVDAGLVLLLGPSLEVVVLHALLRQLVSQISHGNLYLPPALEAMLRRLLVTPDFHRLHHCSDQRYTDSNYSTLVPWFDYLFGTASRRPFAEQPEMELGLAYYRGREDSRLDRLLAMPFRALPPVAGGEQPPSRPEKS